MYGIDGRTDLTEETLDHLEGYRGSRPVRIGNAAHQQLQLDIYGELMDAVYLHNKYVEPVSYDSWIRLRRLIDWLCVTIGNAKMRESWARCGRPADFVYSKMMLWVVLDRGLRLADSGAHFHVEYVRCIGLKVRDEIYEEVVAKGYNPRLKAFATGVRFRCRSTLRRC